MGNLCLGERKAGIHQIGLCLVYQSDLGDFQSLKPLKPSPHQCLALISVPLEDPEGRLRGAVGGVGPFGLDVLTVCYILLLVAIFATNIYTSNKARSA